MAFEYGESYYGLRSFGSSQGEVEDASASITATCTIPNVSYVVARGSGQITGTVTSSTTCSGEVVIIEETDVHSYGLGAYGLQPYTQGDIQTIASATSSATALCVRVIDAACSLTATASITANARRVPEGSALINGASTTTVTTSGNGSRVRTSGGTVSATATISQYCVRVRESSANLSATSSVTANSVFVVNGSATLTSTATIAAICNRVRFGSGTPTANASITVLGFATRGGIASLTGASTIVADSERIHQGHAVTQPESGMTTTCNRVQSTSGAVSATSGTATIGREKWEIIVNDSVTWTQIAA